MVPFSELQISPTPPRSYGTRTTTGCAVCLGTPAAAPVTAIWPGRSAHPPIDEPSNPNKEQAVFHRSSAFTLIELLVVVTIIAVLLALLTPALDRAIYEAELAVCGANNHALGLGVIAYAMDSKRNY